MSMATPATTTNVVVVPPDSAVLYAVVEFETNAERSVRRVIVPFPDARSADRFGLDQGYGEYVVAVLTFAVEVDAHRRSGPSASPTKGAPAN
jgi:hypothetical protein